MQVHQNVRDRQHRITGNPATVQKTDNLHKSYNYSQGLLYSVFAESSNLQ
jgi:hypothetical protein